MQYTMWNKNLNIRRKFFLKVLAYKQMYFWSRLVRAKNLFFSAKHVIDELIEATGLNANIWKNAFAIAFKELKNICS